MISPQFQNLPTMDFKIEEGRISQPWRDFLSLNAQELVFYFGSNKGYYLPNFTEDEILSELNVPENIGRVIFDSTNNVMRVNTDGIFHEVVTI